MKWTLPTPCEWAKRQATMTGIGFTELSNGFASCADPAALQRICDQLGAGTIGVFFERWMSWLTLPLPLTEHDRAAGYWWELSMRHVEVSRTLVFDAPAMRTGSLKPWSPTISTSDGLTRSSWSSPASTNAADTPEPSH